jgi:hypothetical protein
MWMVLTRLNVSAFFICTQWKDATIYHKTEYIVRLE